MQRLHQTMLVAEAHRRNAGIEGHRKLKAPGLCFCGMQIGHPIDNALEAEGFVFQYHFAGFDL